MATGLLGRRACSHPVSNMQLPLASGWGVGVRVCPCKPSGVSRSAYGQIAINAASASGLQASAPTNPQQQQQQDDSPGSNSSTAGGSRGGATGQQPSSSSRSSKSSRRSASPSRPSAASRRLAAMEFEREVKDTVERPQLRAVVAGALAERRLLPSELVLVCNQMAKLCDPQRMPWRAWKEVQAWATQMLDLLDPYLDKLSTYELVVLLAALARMHYSPSTEWLTHFFGATLPRISNCGPGHLTLLMRALSRLETHLWYLKTAPNFKPWMERMLEASQRKLWAFKARELVHLLQAFADLRWMPPQSWLAAYTVVFKRRMESMDPPLMSTAMLSFATLKYDPGIPLTHAMYTNMATHLPLFEAKDLATTAQAIATIRRRLQRRDFLDGFMAEVLQKLPTFGSRTMANLLDALATLVSHGLIRPNTQPYPILPQPAPHTQPPHAQQPHHVQLQAQQSQQAQVPAQLPQAQDVRQRGEEGHEEQREREKVGGMHNRVEQSSTPSSSRGSDRGMEAEQSAGERGQQEAGSSSSSSSEESELERRRNSNAGASSSGSSSGSATGSVRSSPSSSGMDWSRGSIDWSRSSIDWSSGSVDWSRASLDALGIDGVGGKRAVARPARPVPPPSSPAAAAGHPGAPNASSTPAPSSAASTPGTAATTAATHTPTPSPSAPAATHSPTPSTAPPPLPPRAVVYTTVAPVPSHALPPGLAPPAAAAAVPPTLRLPAPSLAWLDATARRVHELLPISGGGNIATAVRGLSVLGLPASQTFLDDFVTTMRGKLAEMSVAEMVNCVQALANFRYRPTDMVAFKEWLGEFSRLMERRQFDVAQVCDLVPAMAGLPVPPPQSLLCTLLWRMRKDRPNALSHASPRRLANLALSFRSLGYKPDFGFLHLYAQAVRLHWSNFEPWEYAAVLMGMSSFSPSSFIIDELWLADLLTMIQCKAHKFDAGSLAYVLQAAALLTRQKAQQPYAPPLPRVPSRQWSNALLSRLSTVMPAVTPPQAIMVLCYLATRHQAHRPVTPPPLQPQLHPTTAATTATTTTNVSTTTSSTASSTSPTASGPASSSTEGGSVSSGSSGSGGSCGAQRIVAEQGQAQPWQVQPSTLTRPYLAQPRQQAALPASMQQATNHLAPHPQQQQQQGNPSIFAIPLIPSPQAAPPPQPPLPFGPTPSHVPPPPHAHAPWQRSTAAAAGPVQAGARSAAAPPLSSQHAPLQQQQAPPPHSHAQPPSPAAQLGPAPTPQQHSPQASAAGNGTPSIAAASDHASITSALSSSAQPAQPSQPQPTHAATAQQPQQQQPQPPHTAAAQPPPPLAAPQPPQPPLMSVAAADAVSALSGASTGLLADLVAKATVQPGLLTPVQAMDLLWALRTLGISLPHSTAAAVQAQASLLRLQARSASQSGQLHDPAGWQQAFPNLGKPSARQERRRRRWNWRGGSPSPGSTRTSSASRGASSSSSSSSSGKPAYQQQQQSWQAQSQEQHHAAGNSWGGALPQQQQQQSEQWQGSNGSDPSHVGDHGASSAHGHEQQQQPEQGTAGRVVVARASSARVRTRHGQLLSSCRARHSRGSRVVWGSCVHAVMRCRR